MDAELLEREHALLSPSSAYTWIECAASTAAQIGQPDESSEYADEGTAAHILMKRCFDDDTDTTASIGDVIRVGEREFEVDDEMAEAVQLYVDAVRERVSALELTGATVQLLIEQRLSIEHITGEKGAKGTSDTVLIAVWADGRAEIEVWDLKYGRGVQVLAEHNYQAMIYAGGAYEEHSAFVDFDRVNIVIHQPRVNEKASEWQISPADLLAWLEAVAKPAAERAMHLADGVLATAEGEPFAGPWEFKVEWFNPGEKQCRFCKAKGVCPALSKHVEDTIGADFESMDLSPEERGPLSIELLDADALGTIYPSLPLIESWGKAVLARIEYELLNGTPVPGVKLVQGRCGARAWTNVDDAETLFKSMRLKQEQMYNFKVISPTQAEKLLKADSPRRWKKVEALVTQRDGHPSVAPESDKRPALVIAPPADDFEPVTVDDGSDLT